MVGMLRTAPAPGGFDGSFGPAFLLLNPYLRTITPVPAALKFTESGAMEFDTAYLDFLLGHREMAAMARAKCNTKRSCQQIGKPYAVGECVVTHYSITCSAVDGMKRQPAMCVVHADGHYQVPGMSVIFALGRGTVDGRATKFALAVDTERFLFGALPKGSRVGPSAPVDPNTNTGAPEYPRCIACDERGDKRCSACRLARYCSRACQCRDWAAHKRYCRTLSGFPADAVAHVPPMLSL